jgi:hypothetical protein
MPRAAILLGFDLGFLFRREAGFESGVGEFNAKHPSLIMRVCDYLRQQRITWQNGLGGFRNLHLEHRKEGPERFAKYSPVEAEVLFDSAWRTMADVFLVFIESHFPASHSIEEIPASERDPSRRRRFRIVWLRAAPKP